VLSPAALALACAHNIRKTQAPALPNQVVPWKLPAQLWRPGRTRPRQLPRQSVRSGSALFECSESDRVKRVRPVPHSCVHPVQPDQTNDEQPLATVKARTATPERPEGKLSLALFSTALIEPDRQHYRAVKQKAVVLSGEPVRTPMAREWKFRNIHS
jgi:hypothetical protein